MASKIEIGTGPEAHTVIHAITIRAQQVANQTGKRIGMMYDLAADRIRLVEFKDGDVDAGALFRIVSPQSREMGEPSTYFALTH